MNRGRRDTEGGRRVDTEDRRVIERISNPRVLIQFKHMRWSVLFLSILFGCMAIYSLVDSITTVSQFTAGMLLALVYFSLALVLWRYYSAIRFYLTNESVNNMDRTMERQAECWLVFAFFISLYVLKYFIFM